MIGSSLSYFLGQHNPCHNSSYTIAIKIFNLFQREVPMIAGFKLATCT